LNTFVLRPASCPCYLLLPPDIMSRTILAIVDDMFFASKIRATAEAVGVEITFVRSTEKLLEKARETKPALVIVDLHNSKLDPVALATDLKTDEQLRAIKLLGFFSHVEADLQRNAIAAGYDQVLPRSVFARDLAEIISL
jgi:CheY-like chemotaxis protein